MKNGIAMISNFSMPVNSLSATEAIGTSVSANRKLKTVRPSAMEMGMPVSISTSSKTKIISALIGGPLLHPQPDLQHAHDHAPAMHRHAGTETPPAKNGNTSNRNRQV